MKVYSLKKSKKVLLTYFHQFQKSKNSYSYDNQQKMVGKFLNLQEKIIEGNRSTASDLAKDLESTYKQRSIKVSLRNFILSLSFALIVAGIIRQTWFELYEIPTGSMRPTFKENDRLIVSKCKYGINVPFMVKHFYFDPNLCRRMNTIVFTSENIDIHDNDMMYFYIFPGKKQFVKRLIGKPGDTLYFYGGLIFGIDENGNDISGEFQNEKFASIEHIPFIRFEGKWKKSQSGSYHSIFMKQMGTPVVKLTPAPFNTFLGKVLSGEIFTGEIKDIDYPEIWGIKNYGMCRILSNEDVPNTSDSDCLFLQIQHPPSLKRAQAFINNSGEVFPNISYEFSYFPLSPEKQKEIFKKLYTARFVVKDGYAYRYGSSKADKIFKLDKVPNGTYEFFDGIAYAIDWLGMSRKLPLEHPLYDFDKEKLMFFYNQGIDFHPYFSSVKNTSLFPSRYVYFRNGTLYLMGHPIFEKDDPELVNYLQMEEKKAEFLPNYFPFIDHQPPLKDGALDVEFIKNYGLKVPQGKYLMLGDNHAMSADSRDFGFVLEDNIKGSPSLLFWPFGERWGFPLQSFGALCSIPNVIIWTLGLLIIIFSMIYSKRKNQFPIDFSKDSFKY